MTQANLNTTLLWRQEPEGMASAFSSVNGANSTAVCRWLEEARHRRGAGQGLLSPL